MSDTAAAATDGLSVRRQTLRILFPSHNDNSVLLREAERAIGEEGCGAVENQVELGEMPTTVSHPDTTPCDSKEIEVHDDEDEDDNEEEGKIICAICLECVDDVKEGSSKYPKANVAFVVLCCRIPTEASHCQKKILFSLSLLLF